MRDLTTGAMLAAPGVVGLVNGTRQWTGIVIDLGTPYIVTTTSNIGNSPAVQYTTSSGLTGNAWVAGRNDEFNVAVFKPVDPTHQLDVVDTTGDLTAPNVGKELAALQYIRGGFRSANTTVAGSRQSLLTELTYLQLPGGQSAGTEGGALVDEFGVLRGMRMEAGHTQEILGGFANESYAVAAADLVGLASALLGQPPISSAPQCTQGSSFPPIPAIYRGSVTVGGASPPAGSTLYAKVSRRGLADLWFRTPIESDGSYQLTLGVCEGAYNNQNVEFWLDGILSTTMGRVMTGETTTQDIDFPAN